MQQRHLGPLKVSALALGCMGMTYGYGEVHDKKQMVKLIHKALELGINFLTLQRLMGKIMKSF